MMKNKNIEFISFDEFKFKGKKINGIKSLINNLIYDGQKEYVIVSINSRTKSDEYFDELEKYFNIGFGQIKGLDYTDNYRIISIKR